MTELTTRRLALFPGGGRHQVHDHRSRAFAAAPPAEPLVARRWERRGAILDQGSTGACTGFTAADWAATDNAARRGHTGVTDADGLALYSAATKSDPFPGEWPPDDTGSDGLDAAKALVTRGWATSYSHGFDLAAVLGTLSHVGPVMIGIAWKAGCDTPDSRGRVTWTGKVRGGHEILADELAPVFTRAGKLNASKSLVGFANHWGQWGQDGRAYMPVSQFGRALAAQGDATIPA